MKVFDVKASTPLHCENMTHGENSHLSMKIGQKSGNYIFCWSWKKKQRSDRYKRKLFDPIANMTYGKNTLLSVQNRSKEGILLTFDYNNNDVPVMK